MLGHFADAQTLVLFEMAHNNTGSIGYLLNFSTFLTETGHCFFLYF
jgi:hypothetical protein